MSRPDNIRLTRRDMLKLGAGGAGMFALGAGGFAVPRGFGSGGGGGGGAVYIEGVPTRPLITSPFNDELTSPTAMRTADPGSWNSHGKTTPQKGIQDALGSTKSTVYSDRY